MSEDAAVAVLRELVVNALERAANVASTCWTGAGAAQAIREMAALVAKESE